MLNPQPMRARRATAIVRAGRDIEILPTLRKPRLGLVTAGPNRTAGIGQSTTPSRGSSLRGEDRAIPRKHRGLIALAVACTTQCPYCI
jgi:alkylhydroperoxidase/carboxymuconolactone decarboxylase family protein YurZ